VCLRSIVVGVERVSKLVCWKIRYMKYSKDFFGIQTAFVEKLAEVTKQNYLDLLPYYSEVKYRFGIPKDAFHPNHPIWLEYINDYYDVDNKAGSFYKFAKVRELQKKDKPKFEVPNVFGFFRYEVEMQFKTIRIHTIGAKKVNRDENSPFSNSNKELRVHELTEMFKDIKVNWVDKITHVRGNSWLYGIDAYRRLFPNKYWENAKKNDHTFGGLALWGQFLDKTLSPKKEITRSFLKKVEVATSYDELMGVFEYRCLSPKVDVREFYEFYGI